MKMHLFKIQDGDIVSVNYDEFIAMFPSASQGIKKWTDIRNQLQHHSQSYGSARYLRVVNNKQIYYFGSGLTKEMLRSLTGVDKNVNDIKKAEVVDTKYAKQNEEWNTEIKRYVKEIYPAKELLNGKVGDYILKYMDVKRKFILLDGDKIKITSNRLRLFKTKGPDCCVCGMKGAYFYKCRNENDLTYHLQLYGVKDGKLVELTKDHILPKSKGGADHLTNMQPMCSCCNGNKGNEVNLKDKVNGISKEELCMAKLDAVRRFCEKNFRSKMTKEELCQGVFKIIRTQETDKFETKSFFKKLSKLIGVG